MLAAGLSLTALSHQHWNRVLLPVFNTVFNIAAVCRNSESKRKLSF